MENQPAHYMPTSILSQMELILGDVEEDTLLEKLRELLNYNLLKDARIFVAVLLSVQSKKNNAKVFGALVALLNPFFPSIGFLSGRESTTSLADATRTQNFQVAHNMASLIAFLVRYGVLKITIMVDLLHQLLKLRTEGNLGIICHILFLIGKRLRNEDPQQEEGIFELLRSIYQDSRTSKREIALLERIFDMRKFGYMDQPKIITLPQLDEQPHLIEVNLSSKPERENLSTPNMSESDLEKSYLAIKSSLMSQLFTTPEQELAYKLDDMTDAEDTKFKKKIYLILKGSLSGDEAAHKILTARIADNQKNIVADVISRACSQETTYSKFYGIITERLCNKHDSWKRSFEEIFKKRYNDIPDFEPPQIRNLGKFWGHALAVESIGLDVFEIVQMNEEASTAANRVLLKFIFQELVSELGVEELHERLHNPSVSWALSHMFPEDDEDDMMFSINYFTAIGLGRLTTGMREKLSTIQANRSEKALSGRKVDDARVKREDSREYRPNLHEPRMSSSRHRSRSPKRVNRNRSRTPPRQRNRLHR